MTEEELHFSKTFQGPYGLDTVCPRAAWALSAGRRQSHHGNDGMRETSRKGWFTVLKNPVMPPPIALHFDEIGDDRRRYHSWSGVRPPELVG
jgi:hypothetical protein